MFEKLHLQRIMKYYSYNGYGQCDMFTSTKLENFYNINNNYYNRNNNNQRIHKEKEMKGRVLSGLAICKENHYGTDRFSFLPRVAVSTAQDTLLREACGQTLTDVFTNDVGINRDETHSATTCAYLLDHSQADTSAITCACTY